MVAFVVDTRLAVGALPLGNIDLTADDGFDACFLAFFLEFDSAVHIAVVGNSHRSHILLFGDSDHIFDF